MQIASGDLSTHSPAASDEAACWLSPTSAGLLETPAEERFDRLTRLACHCLGAPFALLTVLTPDRQWFKSARGTLLVETPLESSFCTYALRHGRTLILSNLADHPQHRLNPVVCGPPHVRFYAGVPLRAPGGEWVGTLCILDNRERGLSDTELACLEDLARLAEREIAGAGWTSSEQAVLEDAGRSLRGSLVDAETRSWSRSAILDISLRENDRSLCHQRALSLVRIQTRLDGAEIARPKAEKLRRALASYQPLGRLDHDQFLVVVPELSLASCHRLAQELGQLVDGHSHVVPLDRPFRTGEELYRHLLSYSENRSTPGAGLSAYSFGSFQLQPLADSRFRTAKTRLLFAYLIGCPERRAPIEILMEEFWPEASQDSGRNNLRVALSSIRGLLRAYDQRQDPILREGNFAGVSPHFPLWTDLDAFTQLCRSNDEACLTEALELYRGPYLEGEYADWALRRRDGYAQRYLEVAHRLASQAFARGDWTCAAQVVERALPSAPDRQDLIALLFRCWLRLGRADSVIRRYRELRSELQDFGMEPLLELVELYHRAELGLKQ